MKYFVLRLKVMVLFIFGCGLLLPGISIAQTINMVALSSAPALDGSDSDWSGVTGTTVALKQSKSGGKTNVDSITVKGGVFGDDVYLLLQWKDSTGDDQHKPYVWDASKKKYVAGKQREDRAALQFAMEGNYTTDWFSGNEFKADMWHWKSARSNPVGLAHDKMTIITAKKSKKSFKAKARNGNTIYILRPGDKGDSLYKTKRYSKKAQDLMPKYIVNASAKGSISDIKAKGVWKNGMWTLELKRKMNTGNADDVVFIKGQSTTGGIAIFNQTGDDDHAISQTLTFQF